MGADVEGKARKFARGAAPAIARGHAADEEPVGHCRTPPTVWNIGPVKAVCKTGSAQDIGP